MVKRLTKKQRNKRDRLEADAEWRAAELAAEAKYESTEADAEWRAAELEAEAKYERAEADAEWRAAELEAKTEYERDETQKIRTYRAADEYTPAIGTAFYAAEDMHTWFVRCENHLSGFDTWYRVHKNSDGSVDGEFRITALPLGYDALDALLSIEDCLVPLPPGYWITTGVRYASDPYFDAVDAGRSESEWYTRYMGMIDQGAYPQRTSEAADNFETARGKVAMVMQENVGKKPSQVYARLHWSPFDHRPARKGK